MSSLSTQTHADRAASAGAMVAEWKWPLIGGAAMVGVLLIVFWNFISRQVLWSIREQADYGHTLVVPFIAGYFVYLNRQRLLAQPFRTTWLGLAPIVVGVAAYILCCIGPRPLQHHNLQAIGLATTICGLVLLFLGWRALFILWFPLAYLFIFGQNISPRLLNIVTFKMQDITARGAHFMLQFGLDVDRSGNTISVHFNGKDIPLNIAEACSGMRMLMAFLALGVAMAYTGLKMFWQRASLVVLAVPTAIFVNILRVVTLAGLSMYDINFAAGDFHSFIGLLWLIPAFLIYLGLMWILVQLVVEQPAAGKSQRVNA